VTDRRSGAAIRLFYFLLFGALGVFWGFLPVYLVSRGLRPTRATQLLALNHVMQLVAPPLVGLAADVWRARSWVLRGQAALTAVAFLGFLAPLSSPAALVVVAALFYAGRAPLGSLADASALEHARVHGGSYGRLRLWGTIGYMLAVLAGGEIRDRLGPGGTLTAAAPALVAMALCAWLLPAARPRPNPFVWRAWVRLLGMPRLWLLLGALALAEAASVAYDSCFALHLEQLGQSGRFIGIAFATGNLAEVVVMAVSARVLARLGAAPSFALAAAVSSLRWFLLAQITSPAAIVALQPLHGITFGLLYVAGVTAIRAEADADTATAAQGLFAATFAVGGIVGTASAGSVFEHQGGRLLFKLAAAAAAGAFLAAVAYVRSRAASRRLHLT
jgi:PPP family 3-phenylpropionic acid transporter